MRKFLFICAVFLLLAVGNSSLFAECNFYECQGEFRVGYGSENAVDGDWDTWTCPNNYNDSAAIIEHHSIPADAFGAFWSFKCIRNSLDIEVKAYYWDYTSEEWILFYEVPYDLNYQIISEEIPTEALISSTLKIKMHLKNAGALSAEYYEGVVDWIGPSFSCEGIFRPEHECSIAVDGDWTNYATANNYGDSVAIIEDYEIPNGINSAFWRYKVLRNYPGIHVKSYYWDYSISDWSLLHESPVDDTGGPDTYTVAVPSNALSVSPLIIKTSVKNASSPLVSGEYHEGVIDWVPSLLSSIWIDTEEMQFGISQIMMSNEIGVSAFTLPLVFNSPYEIDSVVNTGCRTEGWGNFYGTLQSDTTLLIGGYAGSGGGFCMEPGEGCIAKIYWNIPCDSGCATACFDTIFISEQSPLLVVDCEIPENEYTPAFIPSCSEFDGIWYIPGDANNSGGVNISDAVRIINYIFLGGPPPDPFCAGDCNGDCVINISDAVCLINYIFLDGFEPKPYCIDSIDYCSWEDPEPFAKSYKPQADIFIFSGKKGLSLDMEASSIVQAAQFEFRPSGDVRDIKISANASGLQMFEGYVDGLYKVGLIDMSGRALLDSKVEDLITVDYQGSGDIELENIVLSATDGTEFNVTVNRMKVIPTEYKLGQNYPNPFNPETKISYSIPEASNVKLEIINITGQKVTTLVDQYQDAGTYTVRWNGRDSNGNFAASGVYFYKMITDNFSESKRMVLLK
jgi:hypothetical protein